MSKPFWEKPLEELDAKEWEQLCDGCGRCCLKKFEDSETGNTHYTRVVCRYFEETNSSCACYSKRTEKVPECLNVKQVNIGLLTWMPDTCAYKLRYDGKPLYDWHPLIAGSREAMENAGINIAGKVLSEEHVHADGYAEHIIRWVNT